MEELGSRGDGEARKKRVLQLARAFKGASRETREGIAQICRLVRVHKKTLLTEQGVVPDRIFLLASGRVRLERRCPPDRVMLVAQLGRGDLVGACGWCPELGCWETTAVVEDAAALAVEIADLRELAQRDAGVHRILASALLDRCAIQEERLEGLLFRNVESRLARFLLFAIERWGSPTPEGILLTSRIRHHEIAGIIGTGREWVTMTMLRLRRRRILGVAGRNVVVRNVEALRGLSNGGTPR